MNKAIQLPIGLFGGTFDPIHKGHLHIAFQLLNRAMIREIKFIPCYQPVHRNEPQSTAYHRVNMIKLAIHNQPQCSLDTRELQRGGPSFMIDTLIEIEQEFPQQPRCLILGADAYLKITSWKRWQTLLDYCHFIVVNRPLFNIKHPDPWLESRTTPHLDCLTQANKGCIVLLTLPPCSISASLIRERIQNHQSIEDLVPLSVARYIQENGLYL